jgi:parallel beta-helix repeat protein
MKSKLTSLLISLMLLLSMFALALNIRPVNSNPGTIAVPDDYPTIQAAINAANPGDTILVHVGTYQEAVIINKQLEILGDGPDSTIIDGSSVALSSAGLVKITATSGDVRFSGFTVRNVPGVGASNVRIGILTQSNLAGPTYTISCCKIYGSNDPDEAEDYGFYAQSGKENIVFTHNMITQTGANNIVSEIHTGSIELSHNILDAGIYGTDSIFFMTYDGIDVTTLQNVSYNTFDMGTGPGWFNYTNKATGVSFASPGPAWGLGEARFTNMLIMGNTFNNLQNDRRGIGFWNAGTLHNLVGATVTNNTINGKAGSTGSYGIDFYGLTTNTTVLYNTIKNVSTGIVLRSGSAPGTEINYNNIIDNQIGIDWTLGSTAVEARFNYYGDASGPSHSSNGGGTGDIVTDYVDYSPWLEDPFEVTPRTYHVNPTGTIQEAIAEANSDDTILVHDGTYRESLLINKSLAIKAVGNPVIEAPDTRNTYTFTESTATFDPIIFAYGGTMSGGSVSGSGTIDVIIDGFEIDGRNKAVSARFVGILYRNVNVGEISNCSVHHMYDADGQGNGPETFGILVYGNSDVAVEHNEVRDFSRGGIGIQGDNGVQPDPVAVVKGNTVVGNGLEAGTNWWGENGIQIGYGAGGSIIDNNVSQCLVRNPNWVSTGILVISAAQGVQILGNLVADCDTLIAASSVSSPTLDVINGNNVTGATWDAIRLGLDGLCDQCTVSNNIISNSWAGIGVWDSSRNMIKGNTIAGNEYGVIIDGNSNYNNITQNDILANTIDGILVEPYGGYDPTGTQINYNNFVGNAVYGIEQTGANPVNATRNWWGNATGPYHPELNPSGKGDEVGDNTTFEPWLIEPYPPATEVEPLLYVDPATIEYWTVSYGETFVVSVKLDDVTDLFGYEFKLYWNTTLLDLASVEVLPPWSTYIIAVNETREDLGRYWLSISAYSVPSFSGSTTIARLTFRITYDPIYPANKTCKLDLADTKLSAPFGPGQIIYHMVHDGNYTIYATKPKIQVQPPTYTAHSLNHIFNINITVSDVVNLYNFTFRLSYNTTLLDAINLQVGPFLNSPTYTYKLVIDDGNGEIWLWVWSTDGALPASGSGVLATITFKVTKATLWRTNNPNILSCTLDLHDTLLITNTKAQVSHNVEGGAYCYEPKPGDLDYDGYVGLTDLRIVTYWYNPAPYNSIPDINEDSIVDLYDLTTVATFYGEDP